MKPRESEMVRFKHAQPDWYAPALITAVHDDWTVDLWVFGPTQLRKTNVKQSEGEHKGGEWKRYDRPLATLGGA